MRAPPQLREDSLYANSPFELRVGNAGKIPECELHAALASGEMGFLHSFTTGSTVDGPGVRVVAWTTGCQFRCVYCHNPDTWNVTNGIPVSVTQATEQLRKYRHGLDLMAGGFTLSGGEPLMQDRFAVKVLSAAKALGIHTALDTNGALGGRLSDMELGFIDLVLLDIKSSDPARHRRLTGAELGPVVDFANRLSLLRRPVWIRFVLVPGVTDDFEDIAGIARLVATWSNVKRIDVLPFHQMGKFKWEELTFKYELADVMPPKKDVIDAAVGQFRALGLTCY